MSGCVYVQSAYNDCPRVHALQINVFESIILPFALLPLLFFNFNARIMGNEFVLGTKMKIFFGFIGVAVVFINVYLVCLFMIAWDTGDDTPTMIAKWTILALFVAVYVGFIVWLIWDFAASNTWTLPGDGKFEKYADMTMHVNVGGMQEDQEEDVEMTREEQEAKALLGGGTRSEL